MPIIYEILVHFCLFSRKRETNSTPPQVVQGDHIEIHNLTMESTFQTPNDSATTSSPTQPPPYPNLEISGPAVGASSQPPSSSYALPQSQTSSNMSPTYEDLDTTLRAQTWFLSHNATGSSEDGADRSTLGTADGVTYE